MLALALLAALAFAPGALAHALVEEISPADRARLDSGPGRVEVRFTEPCSSPT